MCIALYILEWYNVYMKRLSDLVHIRSGYTFRSSIDSFESGDTEVIQAKDLSDYFDFFKRPRVLFPGESKHLLKSGDILVSARGFAKAQLYRDSNIKAVASSSILVLTPKSHAVSPEFIAMFFNSVAGIKAVHELSSGAAVQSITKESLGQILIPEIPPDKEQALGLFVQAVDDYSAKMQEKQIYLDNLRSTIISKTLKETAK